MIELLQPDVLVLDVAMPVVDGLDYCRSLKADPSTRGNSHPFAHRQRGLRGDRLSRRGPRPAQQAVQPASAALDRGAAGEQATLERPFRRSARKAEQLLLYAQDFRRLVEIERAQRGLLQEASRETVVALARALESRRTGSQERILGAFDAATELTGAVSSAALEEPTLEYGFILHDVGKIGIPDRILRKRDPLTTAERRLLETHTILGEQMIGDAALLRGEGRVSCVPITSAGMAVDIPTACGAWRFHSARASSRSRIRSTR